MIKRLHIGKTIDLSDINYISDVFIANDGRCLTLAFDIGMKGSKFPITHNERITDYVGENDFDDEVKNYLLGGDYSQYDFVKKHGELVKEHFKSAHVERLTREWKRFKQSIDNN